MIIFRHLSSVTMYQLLVYVLAALLAVAIGLSAVAWLPYDPTAILLHAAAIGLLAWLSNWLLARITRIQPNRESWLITALILASIAGPFDLVRDWMPLVVITLGAIGSKFLLAPKGNHLFNPAALGAVLSAVVLDVPASWWLGSASMVPIVAIGGALLVTKIRRWGLVCIFLATYLLGTTLVTMAVGGTLETASSLVRILLIESPLLFFATIMLVEPLTAPQTPQHRLVYGAGIGLLLVVLQTWATSIPYSLELSLLVGNLGAWLVSTHVRQHVTVSKSQLHDSLLELWLTPSQSFNFTPGEFLEYTLGHPNPDARGLRRYFSIASAPHEREILLATKLAEPSSTFKSALTNLKPGETVMIDKLAGDFILPTDQHTKLCLIAGGIGITPYRSMIAHLLKQKERRDIILVFAAKSATELYYRELFEMAKSELGVQLLAVVPENEKEPGHWNTYHGRITNKLLTEMVPDIRDRLVYVSGPESMVGAVSWAARQAGTPLSKIKRDFFPGY